MVCQHCGKDWRYAVMAHQKGKTAGRTHIEDNIFVGKVLYHKANYDNPDVVASCPRCWNPLAHTGWGVTEEGDFYRTEDETEVAPIVC